MARISFIPAENWPPELRAAAGAEGQSSIEQGMMRIAAHRPGAAMGVLAFSKSLQVDRLLPDRLVELLRLRIAFHNQCRSCMAVRYDDANSDGSFSEDLVCSLEKPMEAPDLSDAERAALQFADLFATNHLAIGDAIYANLSNHFTEAQQVELGLACARYLGLGRLAATWNMTDDLPAEYQDQAAEIAPWRVAPALHKTRPPTAASANAPTEKGQV